MSINTRKTLGMSPCSPYKYSHMLTTVPMNSFWFLPRVNVWVWDLFCSVFSFSVEIWDNVWISLSLPTPLLISMFQLPTPIPLGYLIQIALSPASLACSAKNDTRQPVSHKAEDEGRHLRLFSVCFGLHSSALTQMNMRVRTHTKAKRQKLLTLLLSVLQNHFLLVVVVVTKGDTVLKTSKHT